MSRVIIIIIAITVLFCGNSANRRRRRGLGSGPAIRGTCGPPGAGQQKQSLPLGAHPREFAEGDQPSRALGPPSAAAHGPSPTPPGPKWEARGEEQAAGDWEPLPSPGGAGCWAARAADSGLQRDWCLTPGEPEIFSRKEGERGLRSVHRPVPGGRGDSVSREVEAVAALGPPGSSSSLSAPLP